MGAAVTGICETGSIFDRMQVLPPAVELFRGHVTKIPNVINGDIRREAIGQCSMRILALADKNSCDLLLHDVLHIEENIWFIVNAHIVVAWKLLFYLFNVFLLMDK